MSTTFTLVCRACRETYWFGQRSGNGPLRVYDGNRLGAFIYSHLGCDLRCVIDGAEPRWMFVDDWTEFEPDKEPITQENPNGER